MCLRSEGNAIFSRNEYARVRVNEPRLSDYISYFIAYFRQVIIIAAF